LIDYFKDLLNAILAHKLAATLGGCLTLLAAYRLTLSGNIKAHSIKDFNAAAETFRNAFTAMQQNISIYSTSALLFIQFPLHDTARINFVHYLKGKERRRFDKAWQKYEQTCKEVKSNAKEELVGPVSSKTIELKQSISERIEELLSFAKPK
jgi:hypothetical protein